MVEDGFVDLVLPSGKKVYGDIGAVQIRPFKGKDERLIAELTYNNFEKKFLTVLRQVIRGIDPEKLTIGDRLYILVWEAIHSYTSLYPIKFPCSTCLQEIEYEVDLSKLEIISLPTEFKEPYLVTLPSGDNINLRLFRVDDEMKIADYENGGNSSWLYRYALSIVDDKKGVWDRVIYLENINSQDLAAIRAFHEKFYHGPKMQSNYDCPKCGSKGVVEVPFRIEIIFPYGETLTRHFGTRV